MKSFYEWLDNRVFVERKSVDLHHGTTTGAEDSNLSSFRDSGIKPRSSGGFGQGAGYYAFGSKKTASDHASSLLGQNKPLTPGEVVHAGRPMVVTHRAELNPRDYELDKEIQFEDIKKFLMSRIREINRFLKMNGPIKYEVTDDGSSRRPSYDSEIHQLFKTTYKGQVILGAWLKDPKSLDAGQTALNDLQTNIVFKGNVYSAAELRNFMQAVFEKMPSIGLDYKRFMRSIMKRTAEGRASPRAWKYIGDKKISPSSIDVQ